MYSTVLSLKIHLVLSSSRSSRKRKDQAYLGSEIRIPLRAASFSASPTLHSSLSQHSSNTLAKTAQAPACFSPSSFPSLSHTPSSHPPNRLHLNIRPKRQSRDLHTRPGRLRVRNHLAVRLVHLGEEGEGRDVDVDFDELFALRQRRQGERRGRTWEREDPPAWSTFSRFSRIHAWVPSAPFPLPTTARLTVFSAIVPVTSVLLGPRAWIWPEQ